MSKKLLIAPCSYDAAKYACTNFHYSHSMPGGKILNHGVWEDDKFIGVIVYGDSSNLNMASPYDLDYTQICELRRVALIDHNNPVTKIISKSLKLLHKQNPGLLLVISYADPNYNHLGIIYQAGNWIYDGKTRDRHIYSINGELCHGKSVYDKYNTSSVKELKKKGVNAEYVKIKGKFKYLYPLTKSAKKRFQHLHKPYPKKIE